MNKVVVEMDDSDVLLVVVEMDDSVLVTLST
jgi:hypothetical protein